MRVTYRGPSPAVFIPAPGRDLVFRHGEPVDVPDEVADRLAGRPDFDRRARRAPAEVPEKGRPERPERPVAEHPTTDPVEARDGATHEEP